MIARSTGTLAAAYEYDAFGNTLRESGSYAASNPFRFSTKFTDIETGLVYYGLRYYSPTLGRFINKDPIEEKGGLNLYGFCGNNGVNRWDYLGNEMYNGYWVPDMSEGELWATTMNLRHPDLWDRDAGRVRPEYLEEYLACFRFIQTDAYTRERHAAINWVDMELERQSHMYDQSETGPGFDPGAANDEGQAMMEDMIYFSEDHDFTTSSGDTYTWHPDGSLTDSSGVRFTVNEWGQGTVISRPRSGLLMATVNYLNGGDITISPSSVSNGGDGTSRGTTTNSSGLNTFTGNPTSSTVQVGVNLNISDEPGDKNIHTFPGVYFISAHGSGRSISVPVSGVGTMTAERLAEALKSQSSLNYHGESVFLVICNAGVSIGNQPSFAQQLANALKVPVMGASSYVWVTPSGGVSVYGVIPGTGGNPKKNLSQPGAFIRFTPQN